MSSKPKPAGKPAGKSKKFAKTPRPPPSDEERLKRHFGSLCAQIDGNHLKNAIKTCDKILRISPGDSDVVQTKLYLLLQTEQYATALELSSDKQFGFQHAYALYRLNRLDDAAQTLVQLAPKREDSDEAVGAEHLSAQLDYRQGKYDSALETYTTLLDDAPARSEQAADIQTNLTASQKHVDFLGHGFLSSLQRLPAGTLASLETAPPPALALAHAALPAASGSAPAAPQALKPARKSRVPKGVVPGVTPPPDPERWLKKSERTNIPQRRKKGGKALGAAGTTQGVTPVDVPTPPQASGGQGKKKKK